MYCSKTHETKFEKGLANKFQNTHKLCNGDLYKFCLTLQKGVYLYEYTDSLQIPDQMSFPDKKEF